MDRGDPTHSAIAASAALSFALDSERRTSMPYAEANGLRMYYEEQGSGPPLVLLNGATGTLDEVWRGGWASLWAYLAQRYRVVQFEQRGNGRTVNLGGQDTYTYATLARDTAAL